MKIVWKWVVEDTDVKHKQLLEVTEDDGRLIYKEPFSVAEVWYPWAYETRAEAIKKLIWLIDSDLAYWREELQREEEEYV